VRTILVIWFLKIEERKKKAIPVLRTATISQKRRALGHVTGARTSQWKCRLRRGTEGIELGFFDRLRQPDFLNNEKIVARLSALRPCLADRFAFIVAIASKKNCPVIHLSPAGSFLTHAKTVKQENSAPEI
jgi:hypothetical protein